MSDELTFEVLCSADGCGRPVGHHDPCEHERCVSVARHGQDGVRCILDREHTGKHLASGCEWSDLFAAGSQPSCSERVAGGMCELVIGHPAAHARYVDGYLVRW